MSHPFLSVAAVLAVSVAVPAHAAPAIGAPVLLGAVQASAATGQSPSTRAELSRAAETNFQKVDTNNDRALSTDEVNAAQARAQQQALATIATRMSQEFTKLDTDRNGQLSLAEFRAAAPPPRVAANAGATALLKLDANKDGKISFEEYRGPLLTGFDRVDTNKDGTISADERAKATAAR